jgi:peptidoglycan/xylan/chitin deacetylase (PgdA/CDA1 family)
MPLPDGLATVTVTVGPYLTADGKPAAGEVRFEPAALQRHTPSGSVLLQRPVVVRLDDDGAGSVILPASDADGIVPTGVTYRVTYALRHGAPSPPPFDVLLPSSTPTVDLDQLAPATAYAASPSASPFVRTVNGQTGDVTIDATPPSTSASDLTSGTLPPDRLGDGSVTAAKVAADVATQPELDAVQRQALGPNLLRPPRAAQQVISTLQTGHGFTALGAAASNMNDTSDFASGTQSASVTSSGNGANVSITRSNMPAVDMTGKVLAVLLKVTNVARLQRMQFLLGNGNFATYVVQTVQGVKSVAGEYIEEGRWVWVAVPWNVTADGAYNRAATTDIRLTIADDGGGAGSAVRLQVNRIAAIPERHPAFPNGVVTIGFDDCHGSAYTLARPRMDQYGFPGMIYAIPDQVGLPNNLTTAQLQALERYNGWEVAGHATTTAAHNRSGAFTSLTAGEVDAEMVQMKSWLYAGAYRGADHFAYPQGLFSPTVLDATARYYRTGRLAAAPRANELLPPVDLMKIRSWTSGNDLPTLQSIVDQAKAGGAWANLVFHVITTGAVSNPQNETTKATFDAFVDYVAAQGVPVRTMTDVLAAL